MLKGRWSTALAVLFLAILGWYLVYTEQVVRALRAETETMSRMYSEVHRALTSPTDFAVDQSLVRLQDIILEFEVPMVLTVSGDSVASVQNLPFEVDLDTPEGQARVLEYSRELDLRNPPVASFEQVIHFGVPPQFQRLRWVPWFQVGGLLLIFLTGSAVIRSQRKAEADQAWTSTARELAHQLGTPISSLKGWLEVLSLPPAERPSDIEDPEIASEIGADVDRLERVSRRFELIGRRTVLESLDLKTVILAVERYIGVRMPRLGPGVRLNVDVDPGLPSILGNKVLLTWALENIVKNALDALAGRAGTIAIWAFPGEPGWVTLEVRDTGPGVDPEILDQLFQAGTTTKSGGWGVGLTLARRIVEEIHGGRIDLVETGPKGTLFRVKLPARVPPARASDAASL